MYFLFLLSLLSVGALQASSPSVLPASSLVGDATMGGDDEDCCDDDDGTGEVDEDILIDEEESNDDEGVNN